MNVQFLKCAWPEEQTHVHIYIYIQNRMSKCILPVYAYRLPQPGNLSTMRETKRLFSELLAPWKLEHVKLVYHY